MNYIEACSILGVLPNEHLNSIKKAYKKKIKFYHPDNFHGDDEKLQYAQEKTQQINVAWEFIQNNYGCGQNSKADNNAYETSNTADNYIVYTYDYPIYEPVFTKVTLIVTIILLAQILSLIAVFALQPVIDMWDSKSKGTQEEATNNKNDELWGTDNQYDKEETVKDIGLQETEPRYTQEEIALMEDYAFIAIDGGWRIETLHTNFSGEVTIPSFFDEQPIMAIQESAFKNCSDITEVVIPETVTYIGKSSFANCSNIKIIRIPDSVIEFERVTIFTQGAFEDCVNLESVYIGKGLVSLEYHAFGGCHNLKDIYLQSTIEKIDYYAFTGCENISNIYYDGTLEQWRNVIIDGDAFEDGITITVYCCDGTTEYIGN